MQAAERMDEQYRYQRYIYDLSRKYYLLGRDTVLREIELREDQNLLEIGCGTSRNLRILSKHFPDNSLFGIDASQVMLDTARAKLDKHPNNILLRQGLAQEITPADLGCTEHFDHILFSYVLSMIPDWPYAIEQAIINLKPGGTLHIVDFSDQREMPIWFRKFLLQWLDRFHVHPDPALPAYLRELESRHGGQLKFRQLAAGYALIAHYHKTFT